MQNQQSSSSAFNGQQVVNKSIVTEPATPTISTLNAQTSVTRPSNTVVAANEIVVDANHNSNFTMPPASNVHSTIISSSKSGTRATTIPPQQRSQGDETTNKVEVNSAKMEDATVEVSLAKSSRTSTAALPDQVSSSLNNVSSTNLASVTENVVTNTTLVNESCSQTTSPVPDGTGNN